MQREAARQRALESELEQLHRANASALAQLETERKRAAAESMRSAGKAVIDRHAEAFGAADREASCWSGWPPPPVEWRVLVPS